MPDADVSPYASAAARAEEKAQGPAQSLVVTLMKGHSLPTPPSPGQSSPSFACTVSKIRRPKDSQDEAASPADPGTLNLRESGSSYVQSVHWEAVLSKIRGLKEDLVTDSNAPSGSHLFYGPNRHATRDEILAAVPVRTVVDRLMALHFDSYILTPCQYFHPSYIYTRRY